MSYSAKKLLDQLISKVEQAQNDQAVENNPLLSASDLINRYKKHPDQTELFGKYQNYVLKKSLNELTSKQVCDPHSCPPNTNDNSEKTNELTNDQINKDNKTDSSTKDKNKTDSKESKGNGKDTKEGKETKEKKEPKKGIKEPVKRDIEKELSYKKEDIKNLFYSHFPKYLNSNFRFKIGELAYLKWHNEMCLVIINYASQKLLVSSDSDFDENYDSNDQDKSSHMDRRNVWLYDVNEDIYLDADNHNLYSKVNQIKPISLKISQFNYAFINHNINPNVQTKDKTTLRYYFVPLYYVTFPGYKKRCSRLFRFWVQEKDLIKFKTVRFVNSNPNKEVIISSNTGGSGKKEGKDNKESKNKDKEPSLTRNQREIKDDKEEKGTNRNKRERTNEGKEKKEPKKGNKEVKEKNRKKENEDEEKKKTDTNVIINRVRGDKLWNKRTVVPVNEYVYDVIHNVYNQDLISGKYISNGEFFCNSTPWMVPNKIKKVVVKDHKQIITNKADWKSKIKYRKSVSVIIQNFKFLLLMISKLANPANFGNENECSQGSSSSSAKDKGDIEIVQMRIESLNVIRYLESFSNSTSHNYYKFNEVYLNNFYWLDLLVAWVDNHFLNTSCFSRAEYTQLQSLRKLYNRPLSQLLSFEYLCRILSFDVFYVNFLSKIEKNNKSYTAYVPIIQLLLYYMAFVADEYTNNTLYGIRTM